jgi:LysR family glycine cleavage system transcriptional activator
MRLPPLNALKAYEAVSRLSSIKLAAEELSVTQSAVSQHIRNLENFIGRQLIERSGNQFTFTEEGQHLAQVAHHALSNIAIAAEEIAGARVVKAFTVSVPPTFGVKWLIPNLRVFKEKYPDVVFSVDSDAKPVSFQNDGIDAAVRFGLTDGPVEPALESMHLIVPNIVVVGSPSYIAEHGKSKRIVDMAHYDLIHCRPRSMRQAAIRIQWDQLLEGCSTQSMTKHLVFPEDHMALAAAIHGNGLALIERISVLRELESGQLELACAETIVSRCCYRYVWPRGARQNTVRDSMGQWLLESLTRDNS